MKKITKKSVPPVESRPTVWISQYRPEFDFSMAVEWGDCQNITEVEVPRIFTGPEFTAFSEDVRMFLDRYHPRDYLLLVGNPYQMIIICNQLRGAGYERVNVLKWLKKDRRYQMFVLPLVI